MAYWDRTMKAAEKGKRDEERVVVLRAVMTAKQVDALWEWMSTHRQRKKRGRNSNRVVFTLKDKEPKQYK